MLDVWKWEKAEFEKIGRMTPETKKNYLAAHALTEKAPRPFLASIVQQQTPAEAPIVEVQQQPPAEASIAKPKATPRPTNDFHQQLMRSMTVVANETSTAAVQNRAPIVEQVQPPVQEASIVPN